jgi:MATE family multidrug resistance protein
MNFEKNYYQKQANLCINKLIRSPLFIPMPEDLIQKQDLSCSVRSFLAAALPMAASLLSGNLMQIFDRAMLAHYSIIEMNSAALAYQAFSMILLPMICFATISEVFVGQFNGAKAYRQTSTPIFQMVIFLIVCCFIICPLANRYSKFFISPHLYEYGHTYFSICLLTTPFQIIHSSISAFFVGTRRTGIILQSVILGNTLNIGIAYALIFGIKDVIPSLGSKGAGIATLISTIISSVILVCFFLNRTNAKTYNTRSVQLNSRIFKKNIELGIPFSLGYFLGMTIWVSIANILTYTSMDEATVQNVTVTILNFFLFLLDGMQRGVMALASNCIGAKRGEMIGQLIKSTLKVAVGVSILMAIPLLIFPETTLKYVFHITDQSLVANFKKTFFVVWTCLTLMTVSDSCFGGLLNAGGDAKFVTYVKMFVMVFIVGLPMLAFFHFGSCSSLKSWMLSIAHQITSCSLFYWRYKRGSWKHNLIEFQIKQTYQQEKDFSQMGKLG